MKIKDCSDRQLMALARKYGTQALLWRQKFIGLLPEVNARRLYEKKGYSSVFEFGKRMAGLSEAQIRLALNLDRRFKNKPVLRDALVKGEVSINKLTRVASIATPENEEELCASAKVLSKSSLDVLVKDIKYVQTSDFESQNGLLIGKNEVKSLPGQKFQLSEEVIEKLNSLYEKGINVNKLLVGMLEEREKNIREEKKEISQEITKREEKRKEKGKKPSRYVSVKTKRILREEYGTKCSVPTCQKQSEHLHHTARFSLTGSNNPHFLAPLCREHHDIAHVVDSKYVANKLTSG